MGSGPAVVVYAGDIVNADLLKGILESKGISSYLQDEFLGREFPYIAAPGGAGAVKVVVAEQDLERARPIVAEYIRDTSH
jgi:hypothetical protein